MNRFHLLVAMAFLPFIAGVVSGAFLGRRMPRRGWMALMLVLAAGTLWSLSEPNDRSAPERLWTLPCFTFVAPIAVIHSFRIRKEAPDRVLANAAFVGSLAVAVALVLMLGAAAWLAWLTLTSAQTGPR